MVVGSGALVGALNVCDGVGTSLPDVPVPIMLVSVPFSWKIPPLIVEGTGGGTLDEDEIVEAVGATLIVEVVVGAGGGDEVVEGGGGGGGGAEEEGFSDSLGLDSDFAKLPSRLKTLIVALEPFGTVTTQYLLPTSPFPALPLMTAPKSPLEGLISHEPTQLPEHSTFIP